MNIRAYSSKDREACMSIFRSNVPAYFSPDEEASFSEFLARPKATLVCGEDGGEVVAFGGYYVKGNVGRLCWGMVHSSKHRLGFGTEMLRERMHALLTLPEVQAIGATTSQHSADFFSRFGFEKISAVPNGHARGLHAVEMQFVPGERRSHNQLADPAFPSVAADR
jgi:hypothetical protein